MGHDGPPQVRLFPSDVLANNLHIIPLTGGGPLKPTDLEGRPVEYIIEVGGEDRVI